MSDKQPSSFNINWPSLAVLVTMLGGLYWWTYPLVSSRPDEPPLAAPSLIGEQQIEARLWQDPMAAVQAYLEARKKSGDLGAAGGGGSNKEQSVLPPQAQTSEKGAHRLEELARQIFERVGTNATASNLLMLPIFIPGGTYAEDTEIRCRMRYAVLSALGVAGFIPTDANRLGLCEIDWPHASQLEHKHPSAVPRLSSLTNQPGRRLLVPFEWMQPDRLKPSHSFADVLVLWFNADEFDDHPSKRLAQLIEDLGRRVVTRSREDQHRIDAWPGIAPLLNQIPWLAEILGGRAPLVPPPTKAPFTVKLIGPNLSPLLHEDFSETMPQSISRGFFAIQEILEGVEIYSCWATVADAILLRGDALERAKSAPRRETVAAELKGRGLKFINVTCTDDELAEALIEELALRQICGAQSKGGAIAILSEWDTSYGRALPFTFAAKTQEQKIQAVPFASVVQLSLENSAAWPSNILAFSYLRGVDGKAPGEKADDNQRAKEKAKIKDTQARLHEMERPEGDSQLDYIPRLAARLLEVDQEWKRHHGHGLEAIGVLGSDVYDKLLLLQSLRRAFPRTLFFTTDLDARLLHPSQTKWTRNMIVASSFGLELHPDLQKSAPPFRDTYQTAAYLATLAALGYPKVTEPALAGLKPRVFEIGNQGAVDISTQPGSPLHPPRPVDWWKENEGYLAVRLGAYAALGVLALGLVSAYSRTGSRWLRLGLGHFSKNRRLSPPLSWHEVKIWNKWKRCNYDSPEPKDDPILQARRVRFRKVDDATRKILGFFRPLALTLPLLIIALIWIDQSSPAGEPFSLLKGVSAWPAVFLRVTAISCCLWFFAHTRARNRESKQRLAGEFGLKYPGAMWAEVASWWHARCRFHQPKWNTTFRYWLWISASGWRQSEITEITPATATTKNPTTSKRVSPQRWWDAYNHRGWFPNRFIRILPRLLLGGVMAALLWWLFGTPASPHRGISGNVLNTTVWIIAGGLFLVVACYVVDAVRLCATFIRVQSELETNWPQSTLDKFKAKLGIPEDYLREWIDVRFVALRTEEVDKLIFWPFFVLALLAVSCIALFDRIDAPIWLLGLMAIAAGLAVFSVKTLRDAAEHARRRAIERLNQRLLVVLGGGEPANRAENGHGSAQSTPMAASTGSPLTSTDAVKPPALVGSQPAVETTVETITAVEGTASSLDPDWLLEPAPIPKTASVIKPDPAAQIRLLISRIEQMNDGAFAPLARRPVVKAMLMPFGGFGLVTLIEFLVLR